MKAQQRVRGAASGRAGFNLEGISALKSLRTKIVSNDVTIKKGLNN